MELRVTRDLCTCSSRLIRVKDWESRKEAFSLALNLQPHFSHLESSVSRFGSWTTDDTRQQQAGGRHRSCTSRRIADNTKSMSPAHFLSQISLRYWSFIRFVWFTYGLICIVQYLSLPSIEPDSQFTRRRSHHNYIESAIDTLENIFWWWNTPSFQQVSTHSNRDKENFGTSVVQETRSKAIRNI